MSKDFHQPPPPPTDAQRRLFEQNRRAFFAGEKIPQQQSPTAHFSSANNQTPTVVEFAVANLFLVACLAVACWWQSSLAAVAFSALLVLWTVFEKIDARPRGPKDVL